MKLLNTKGKNKDAVLPELVSFLEYVGNPAEKEHTQNSFVQSLETQISTIKRDREWRNKYMLLELTLAKERKEGLEEGLEKGLEKGLREGLSRGELRKMIALCCCKLAKGKSVVEIADALECDLSQVSEIAEVAQKYAPDYDVDRILEELYKEPSA